jgi:hypothetical protein
LRVFWSEDKSGVPRGDPRKGEAESLRKELPVAERVEARDFLSPCADEGRPGDDDRLFTLADAEGADGVHSFPARSASNFRNSMSAVEYIWRGAVYLFTVLGCSPAVVSIGRTQTIIVPSLVSGGIIAHEVAEWQITTELRACE